MPENTQEAFDRGHAAGKRDARLDGHDSELEDIGTALGSLFEQVRAMGADLTTHITDLMLQVQELALNAKSSAKTALALAEGIEKERSSAAAALVKEKDKAADTIRQEKDNSEKKWTPISRFLATLAGVVGVVVVVVAIASLYTQFRRAGG